MTEYCSVCGVNELLTPEEIATGVCENCSLTLTDDALSDDSQLFDVGM